MKIFLKANEAYKDKYLRIKSLVYDINEDSSKQKYVELYGGKIRCNFESSHDSILLEIKKRQGVIIKDKCIGKKNKIILTGCTFDKKNAEELIEDELDNLTDFAQTYYTKPFSLGGGENSFKGFHLPKELL